MGIEHKLRQRNTADKTAIGMSAGDIVIILSRLCALRVSTLVPFIIHSTS